MADQNQTVVDGERNAKARDSPHRGIQASHPWAKQNDEPARPLSARPGTTHSKSYSFIMVLIIIMNTYQSL